MLMDQKQLCDSMIDEKNKLINDFKQVQSILNKNYSTKQVLISKLIRNWEIKVITM